MKKIFSFFITVLFVLTFFSCEIGLGEAVDTEAPKLEIVTPKPGDIIRDKFRIGGTWSDDGTISNVSIEIKRQGVSDKGKNFYSGIVVTGKNGENNSWYCDLDPLSDTYLMDGAYDIQVAISDEGGHTTTQNCSFTIDNTPPVIVLQRPGEKLGSDVADSYGQSFTLEGQAADDNNVSLIEVKIYSDEACTDELKTIQLSNVPNSINLDVAKFKAGERNEYADIYDLNKIYDIDDLGDAIEKFRYCKIIAYDGAQRYPIGENQSAEDTRGNKTETYYLYEEVASLVLKDNRITDLYHMFNGTYDTNSSRNAVSPESILAILKNKQIRTGYFSLNPANNPTFNVSGRKPLQRDGEDFKEGARRDDVEIINGSKIQVEIATGLDGIPLRPDTLGVYVVECDENGNRKEGATESIVVPQKTDKYGNEVLTSETAIAARKALLSKSGTSYKIVATLDGGVVENLQVGHNYIIGVYGCDENGTDISDFGNVYGFYFASSGAAPKLTIISPSTGNTYKGLGDSLVIEGYATSELTNPDISIKLINSQKQERDVKIYSTADITAGKYPQSEIRTSTPDNQHRVDFRYEIPSNKFDQSSYGQYTVYVEATNGDKSTSHDYTILYDVTGPVISKNSLSPVAEKYNADYTIAPGNYLNGIVTLKISIEDNDTGIASVEPYVPYLEILQNDVPVTFSAKTNPDGELVSGDKVYITNAALATVYIDTTSLSNGNIIFNVHAWDKSGNKGSVPDENKKEFEYIVDQATDYPVVMPNSTTELSLNVNTKTEIENGQGKNMRSQGAPYLVKLKDDDSVQTVKVWRAEINSDADWDNQNLTYQNITPNNSNITGTDLTYSINIPNASGFYRYKLEVTDVNGKKTNVGPFAVYVTAAAPTILGVTPEPGFISTNAIVDDAENGVEAKKINDPDKYPSSIKNKIEILSDQAPFYVFRKTNYSELWDFETDKANYYQTEGEGKNAQFIATINPNGNSTTYTYTDTVTPSETTNYYYVVRDKNYQESNTKDVTCTVDNNQPNVVLAGLPTLADTKAGITSFTFQGTADDNSVSESGVQKVELKVTDDKTKTKTKTVTVTGTQNWVYALKYADWSEVFADEGKKLVDVRVIDNAGNYRDLTQQSFIYDKANPNLVLSTPTESQVNGNFTVSGKAWDTYGLKTRDNVTITVKKDDGTVLGSYNATATAAAATSAPNTDNFSVTVETGTRNYISTSGKYILTVTVKDKTNDDMTEGNITSTDISVLYDVTAPTITISSPDSSYTGANALSNANFTFAGTAKDNDGGSGVASFSYQFTKSGTAPAANDANWVKVDSTTQNWSFQKALGNGTNELAEGAGWYLWVKAADKAGNETLPANYAKVVFDVDKAAPVLAPAMSSKDQGENIYTKNLTISGKVYDTNSMAASNNLVIEAIDPATNAVKKIWDKSVTVADSKTLPASDNISLTVKVGSTNSSEADYLADGSYTIRITAKDVVGKTATWSKNIIVDTTAPTVEVSAPEANEILTSAPISLSGTVSDDASGIVTGTIQNAYKLTPVSGETEQDATEIKGDVTVRTNGNWTASIPASQITKQGKYTLTVTLKDKADHSTTTAARTITFDTAKPVISELKVKKDDAEVTSTNDTLTVSLKASDTWGLRATNPVIIKDSLNSNSSWNPTLSSGVYSLNLPIGDADNKLKDGKHTLTVTVYDLAGQSTSETAEIIVDTQAPYGTVTNVPTVIQTQGESFVFKGTVTEPGESNLNKVYISFNNSTWIEADVIGNNWQKEINFSEYSSIFGTEDEKSVYVKAVDEAGNESTSEKITASKTDFVYDKSKPVLKADTTERQVNGNFTVTGKAWDTYGLAVSDNITVVVKDSAGAAITGGTYTTTATAATSEPASDNFTVTIPTGTGKAISASGKYKLSITSKDKTSLGKVSDVVEIDVIYDVTAPTITISSPDGSYTGANALSNANFTFAGTAKDNDGGSGVASFSYQFTKSATAPAANSTNWVKVDSTTQNWSFQKALGNGTNELAEGADWYLWVKAADKAGNETELENYASVKFDVDKAAPVLAPAMSSKDQGENIYTKNLTVSGKVYDTNSMAASNNLVIEAIDSATNTVKKTWNKSVSVADSKTLPASDNISLTVKVGSTNSSETDYLADGSYTIRITAKDVVGKTATWSKNIIVDTTAPTVEVSAPEANEILTSAPITLSGTVSDDASGIVTGTGVGTFTLTPVSGETEQGATTVPGTVDVRTNGNWSGRVSTIAKQGKYTLTVTLKDKADHSTTTTARTITFDTAKPVISGLAVKKNGTAVTYTNGKITVSGTARDTWGLRSEDSVEIKDSLNASSSWKPSVSSDGSFSQEIELGTEAGKLADGKHKLTVTAYDLAGQSTSETVEITVDTQAPTATVAANGVPTVIQTQGESFVFKGTVTEAGLSGVEKVEISFDGTKWVEAVVVGGTQWQSSVNFSENTNYWGQFASTAQGPKTIKVRATDNAGNVTATPGTATFTYDIAKPEVRLSATEMQVNNNFTVSGKAWDTYGLAASNNVTVTVKKTDGTVLGTDNSTATAATSEPASDNFTVNVPATVFGGTSGTYTVEVKAEDKAGKVSDSKTVTVVYDVTAPTITISSPDSSYTGANALSNANFTFAGTAKDNDGGSGVASFSYQFTKSATAPAENDTNWVRVDSTTQNWSFQKALGNETNELAEGADWYLWVKAADKAGNETAQTNYAKVKFDVDKYKPQLDDTDSDTTSVKLLSAADKEGNIYTGNLTFSAKVWDTNGLAATDSVIITATNAATGAKVKEWKQTVSATAKPASANVTKTIKISSANSGDADYLPDGSYTITAVATDVVGKTATWSQNIIVDTTAPTVEVTSHRDGDKISTVPMTLEGTSSDNASGIKSGTYELKFGATTAASGDLTIQGNGNWRAEIAAEKFTNQGDYSFTVTVEDKAGYTTTTTPATITFDNDIPHVEITSPSASVVTNSAFVVSGKAYDTYGIKTDGLVVTLVDSAANKTEIAKFTPSAQANPSSPNWSVIFVTSKDVNAWSGSAAYSAGDIVKSGTDYYVCTANVAADGNILLTNTSYWKKTTAYNISSDGKYTVEVKAVDKAEKADNDSQRLSILIDTQAPTSSSHTVNDGAISTNNKGTYRDNDSDLIVYNISQIPVRVTASDEANGSGLSSVSYTTKENPTADDWSSLGLSGGAYAGTVTCDWQGVKNIKIRCEDKAGNTNDYSIPVRIDTKEPSSASANISGTKLVNKKEDIYVEITAADAADIGDGAYNSGIAKVELIKIGGTSVTEVSSELFDDSGKCTITIPSGKLGNGVAIFRVTDNAKNYTDISPFQFQVDETKPSVSIDKLRNDGATSGRTDINKTVTISGTAKDDQGLRTPTASAKPVVVKYYYADAAGDWDDSSEGIVTVGDSDAPELKPSNASEEDVTKHDYSTWSFSLDTSSENNKYLFIRAVATDAALNESDPSDYVVYVNQDTDRPVIKYTNLTNVGTDAAPVYILKFGDNAKLEGSVKDDDETSESIVDTFIASKDKLESLPTSGSNGWTYDSTTGVWSHDYGVAESITEEPGNWAKVYTGYYTDLACTAAATSTWTSGTYYKKFTETTSFNKTTGEYSYVPGDVNDGTKTVYFYVVDNNDGVFYTGNSTALNKPYQQYKTSTKADNTAAITYNSDSNNPAVQNVLVRAYKADKSANGTPAAPGTSLVLGGTEKKYAKFTITAYDANEIEGITLDLKYNNSSNAETHLKIGTQTSDLSDSHYYGFTKQTTDSVELSTDGTNYVTTAADNTKYPYKEWTTDFIDISGMKTGTVEGTIMVYDKSGLYGNSFPIFVVDNDGPAITITSPAKTTVGSNEVSEEVSADVSLNGSVTDVGNAGATTIEWITPTEIERAKTDAEVIALTTWKDTRADESTVANWKFVSSFLAQSKDDTERAYYSSKTDDGVYSIPVYFKSTDALGNVTLKKDFVLTYNPDADKPKTDIAYPSTSDYDNGQNFVTLGGTIRVSGSVNIPSGITTPYGVYIQIADANGKFVTTDAATDLDTTGTAANKAKTTYDYGDKIVTQAQVAAELGKDNLDGFADATAKSAWWGIKVNRSSNSWSINLNGDGKMNPSAGSTNNVKIRVCGVNAFGKVGNWSEPVTIHIDDNAPSYEGTLYKYSTTYTSAADYKDATPTEEKEYRTGMYLKGNWVLCVKISDEAQVKLDATGAAKKVNGSVSEDTNYYFTNQLEEDGRKVRYVYIPVSESATYSLTAYDMDTKETSGVHIIYPAFELNMDNTAPTLTTIKNSSDTAVANTKVSNSNYMSNFKTNADDGNGSGFKMLAYYFKRSATSTIELPLPEQVTGGWTAGEAYKGVYEGTGALTKDSNLYGVSLTGAITYDSNTQKTTFTASKVGDTDLENLKAYPFIRIGGIIKLGGSFYKISNVNGLAITVDTKLTAKANATAFAAAAFVVDNLDAEVPTWNNGTNAINLDDGDGVFEFMKKTGNTASIEFGVCADELDDGPIDLCCVAFDEAGNYTGQETNGTAQTTSIFLANHTPRLSKVYLATDLNGNGTYSDDEFGTSTVDGTTVKYYSALTDGGAVQEAVTIYNTRTGAGTTESPYVYDPVLTMRDKLGVALEFVSGYNSTTHAKKHEGYGAGNGDIRYKLGVSDAAIATATPKAANETWSDTNKIATMTGKFTGTTDAAASALKGLEIPTNTAGLSTYEITKDTEEGSERLAYINISLWDSTPGTTIGDNDSGSGDSKVWGSQWTALNIPIWVDVTDDIAPTVRINDPQAVVETTTVPEVDDDGEETGDEIDVTNALGHVDLGSTPDVSGKIVFTGTVNDEKRISSLRLSVVDSQTTPAAVAFNKTAVTDINLGDYDQTYGYVTATEDTNHVGKYEIAIGSDVKFEVTNQTFDIADGHTITWKMTIDTAKVGTADAIQVAKSGVKFMLTAGNSDTDAANATTTDKTVNIVPYVTGIKTSLDSFYSGNSSVYARTAQGHYIAYDKEAMSMTGFNLIQGATVTIKYDDNTNKTTTTLGALTSGAYPFTLPAGAKSGKVKVTVNGVDSVNNTNTNNAETTYYGSSTLVKQNMQANGVNNDNLTDDLEIDIWEFKTAANPRDGEILTPEMQIGPNGEVGFAFVNGNFYFNMAGPSTVGHTSKTTNSTFASQRAYEMEFAPYYESAFAFDAAGRTYGVSTNQDANTNYSAYTTFYFGRRSGTNGTGTDDNAWKSKGANYSGGTYRRRIQSTTADVTADSSGTKIQNTSVYRAMSPSIATVYNSTSKVSSIYVAFYDAVKQQIRYKWATMGDSDNLEMDVSKVEYKGMPNDLYQVNFIDRADANYGYLHITEANSHFKNKDTIYLYDIDGKLLGNYKVTGIGTTWIGLIDSTTDQQIYYIPENVAFVSKKNSYTTDIKNVTSTITFTGKVSTGDRVSFVHNHESNQYAAGNISRAQKDYLVKTGGTNSMVVNGYVQNTAKKVSVLGGQMIDVCGGPTNHHDSFMYSDDGVDPSVSSNLYSVLGTASLTKTTAAVAIGAVPASVANNSSKDVVCIAWYDGKDLKYAYSTNPQSDDGATAGSNFTKVATLPTKFSGAGYNVKMKVDATGGIHLAFFTTSGAKLRYAYAPSYTGSFTCVDVDTYALTTNDIGLDVAKDGSGNLVPYISYLSGNQLAKVAFPVAWNTNKATKAGIKNNKYTGDWEISVVPSKAYTTTNTYVAGSKKTGTGAASVTATTKDLTPKFDTICVGVHKNWTNGVIAAIPTATTTTNVSADDADSNYSTIIGGNGTAHPALAYTVVGDDSLQLAQMK